MASSQNGRFSGIVLTFRRSLGDGNILFYSVKCQNFFASVSDYISGVNVMNDKANF